MKNFLFLCLGQLLTLSLISQSNSDPFKQLGTDLPTPNEYRNASGAPGHKYWQNRADYKMNITLQDDEKKITGDETIIIIMNLLTILNFYGFSSTKM